MKKLFIVALVSCYSCALFSADRLRSRSLPNPEELNKMKYACWINLCTNIVSINQNIQIDKQYSSELNTYMDLKRRISQEENRSERNTLWSNANDVLDSMIVKAENVLKQEIRQSSAIHVSYINPIK